MVIERHFRVLTRVLAIAGGVLVFIQPAGAANAIQIENQKPGTLAWQIGLPPYVNSNDTDQWIRGYASATSINKGEKITFNITVNPYNWKPGTQVPYYIDVYRVGWYGGLGGRLMKHIGPFIGVQQPGGTSANGVTSPGCPYDPNTGMIACQWTGDGLGKGSYTLDTSLNPDGSSSPDWTSGVYLALLSTAQMEYGTQWDADHQTYIIFAIREDSRPSDILFQQAVATYQAYNDYPDDGQTGKSLYDSGSYGSLTSLKTLRAVKVSFDRPYTYADHTGAGDFLHWELYFIRWQERNGYDVTYSTDVDTHANGTMLLNHKAFLSVGHPEYWSREMRTAVENARDHGTSIGFFAANAVYSQIRFEPSPVTGAANRVIVCYKDASLDPVNQPGSGVYNPSLTTVPFRNPPVNNPEQSVIGVMYDGFFSAELPAQPYVVQNSSNWVYNGTGFVDGSSAAGILGYELDRQFTNAPFPPAVPGSYVLVATSPYTDNYGAKSISNASIYQASSGAWVFGSGTIDWSWALDGYLPPAGINTRGVPAPNAGIQQMTANLLNRFITGTISNPLAGPTNLTGSANVTSIILNWQDNTTAATAYSVERSPDGVVWTQLTSTLGATATTFTDNTPGTFSYRVRATDGTNFSAYSNTLRIATIPAEPTGLSAVPSKTIMAVDLSWTDNAITETAYVVERSADNGATWTVLTSTLPPNAQAYSDSTVAPSTTYSWRVKAINASGSSLYSDPANIISPSLPPPGAPGTLTAAVSGGGNNQKIVLKWTVSTYATTYVVQRSLNPNQWPATFIATLGAAATSYTDGGLARNTTYYYRVGALNSANPAAPVYSNTASAKTK